MVVALKGMTVGRAVAAWAGAVCGGVVTCLFQTSTLQQYFGDDYLYSLGLSLHA